MRRTAGRLLFSVSAALLAPIALPVAAQEPGSPSSDSAAFGERIEVELVNVDVWVADEQGRAVTGLGPADFEVLHDGSVVPVSHFTEVRAGAAVGTLVAESGSLEGGEAALVPSEPSVVAPHHVVVYFDQSRLHPSNYPPLVRGLKEFFSLQEVDPERVLVLRQSRSLAVEAAFGSTKKELLEALERLAKSTAEGMDLQAEANYALDAIRRSWEENQAFAGSVATAGAAAAASAAQGAGAAAGAEGANVGGPRAVVGGVGTGGGPDACGSFLGQIQPVLSSWARASAQRASVTLSNLSDISSFLAGLPGIKTLLYLSDGLETEPGAALATYAAGFCPAGSSQLLADAKFQEITPRFLELTRHANSNRVTIHALQATGLRTSRGASAAGGRRARAEQRSAGSFDRVRRNNDRRGLEVLARETGGRIVVDQNEFAPELDRIARELGTYYSLAYVPPATDPNSRQGRGHRIEVRIGDGSLTARYRQGYLEKDTSRWLLERIEGALNLGISENPLEIRLGAGDLSSGAEGSFRLPLHVMVPAERLAFLTGEAGTMAQVVVRVMTRSIDSSKAFMFDKTFQIPGAPGATGFADLTIALELPAGAHLAAVGVRDAGSGEASFVSTTVQIGSGG